ncbi:MAG: SPFH domain-containing protein [bacterium]
MLVLLVLIGLMTLGVGFPFFLQWLAKENIFFTTVKEGTVKAIMRGDSFERFIMSFAGYHLNDPRKECYEPWLKDENGVEVKVNGERVKLPDWEVVYHGKGNKKGFKESDDCYDNRSWLLKKLGLYWVGWPWANSVYIYGFEWNETYTEKGGEEKVLPRSEATDFIYVADFTYAIVTEGAETKDRLPTDELTLVTVAIRNPYRALFSGEDWMRRVTAAINRHVRNFIGSKDFQELISLEEDKWADFSKPIIELSNKLLDDRIEPPFGLKGRYGAEIRTADLQTIELSGDAKKQDQEATTKEYVAKQEAKATLLTGQAKADVIKMIGDKEAEALEARLRVIKEHGATGELLAQLDAMRDASGAGARIIWANNPFVPLVETLKPKKGGAE